ncbi:MAG: ABC transporter ATP-binding protein [Candidatus Phocaeicola faecipullorum]|nr:ABC transporter ATP-binding protein [Candidatus Phocaeicola faecipullorum]
MTDENVIYADNLTKKFGNFTAVDHITFSVRRGEIFGFLGANGAGKTTAMRMLCGLSQPTEGKGVVAGFDILREPEKVKRNIGYMSQKFSLYEDLKVWENLRLYGGIYGMKDREISSRTEAVLSNIDMETERNTMVRDLPLGWKQKLAFTVSTFHSPKIVFLDEPTGGVDPITRRRFWEQIYGAAAGGITVFVTTHYMDEAEYCDRVSIMVDGKIKALDSPKVLRNKFGVSDMDGVFRMLAREATRKGD